MTNAEYVAFTKKHAENSPLAKNALNAFSVGGGICALGQIFYYIYLYMGVDSQKSFALVSLTLIFVSVVMTSLNIFDRLAKFAGAGTLVPITGFANAVVSPALDTKSEGFISGVGTKLFSISGPVILYGILSSVIYGIFYYFKIIL